MNEIISIPKTYRPFVSAFAWGCFWLATLLIGFFVAYGHFPPQGFGLLLGMTMTASALAGFTAKRRKTPVSFWKIGGIYLLFALAVLFVSSFGARNH